VYKVTFPITHHSAVSAVLESTSNSSGDETANVNFLYDDIVHVLQSTAPSPNCTTQRSYNANA